MLNKRGVIELQFKWVFVLIAGALILLLFVSFALKHKQASENEITAKILTYASSMLSSSAISGGSSNQINLPGTTEISYDCESSRITINRISKEIPGVIVAPQKISDNSIITFALAVKVPFTLTNLMYIIPYNTKYYFVHDTTTAKRAYTIFNLLPEGVDKKMVMSLDNIRKTNKPTTIVFLKEPQLTDELKSINELTILKIQDKKIISYDKNLNQIKTINYATDAELISAIINPQDIECTQKKLIALLPEAVNNQIEKMNSIKDQSRCNPYYYKVLQSLEKLRNAISMEQISTTITELEQQNLFLKKQSCPVMY